MIPTQWHHCYGDSWKPFLVPQAMSHPAKFSKALIERIIDHGLERGYWNQGDIIADPFGGVGLGGIACAYRGMYWIGCELEPKFVALAEQNFALHAHKLKAMNKPLPHIVQGDSRNFVGIVDGAITSPPYAAIASGAGGLNTKPAKEGQQGGRSASSASQDTDQRYGESAGQIARLTSGQVDSVITSPPFSAPNMQPCIGQGVRKDLVAAGKEPENNYGNTEGQIGNDKGETYWQAMALVYASVFQSIKPGGVLACVVKNYVSKKQIVPLCDDTLRLLEHVGFTPMERVHAMLVRESVETGLDGTDIVSRTERKSFFRRLAEKKGSPRIDFEEVLIVLKPL